MEHTRQPGPLKLGEKSRNPIRSNLMMPSLQIRLIGVCVPVAIFVLLGVVETERCVDRGALVHELDGTAGISADITNGQ